MLKSISKKSGLAALALGVMTMAGATAVTTTSAQAGWHGGGGHGGWGHGGGWHHGGHWGGGWGHGPRWGLYGRSYAVRGYYGCYRAWRTIYVPGEGYVRSRVRVCD